MDRIEKLNPSAASEPGTPTGRKVVAIYGDVLLDDVMGIEEEARAETDHELLRYREALVALGMTNELAELCFCWYVPISPTDHFHNPVCEKARALLADPSAANDAEARITEPWRKALTEAWALIDFLVPTDEPIGGFRRNVRRVIEARRMAEELLPELVNSSDGVSQREEGSE